MAPDYPLILEDCDYPQLKFENTDPDIIYNFYNTYPLYYVVLTKW
jgi:hypothetical protein